MKKIALFGFALLAACAGQPMLKEPTAVTSARIGVAGAVEARAVIESRDRKPAWARLYVVPAAQAEEAERAIAADRGRLGRWAMIPVVSQPMEGIRAERVRMVPPTWAVHSGDLLVLAIDPVSPSRFIVSDAQIVPADANGEAS